MTHADFFRKEDSSPAHTRPGSWHKPRRTRPAGCSWNTRFRSETAPPLGTFFSRRKSTVDGGVAVLKLRRSADGQQVLIAVVGPVQVVAVLRIPEIDLDASGPEDFGIPGRGLAVERADRDLHFLGELAPIDDAVVAALKDEGISVLDAVRVHVPLMRVERAVEIRAVARRQETAGPDVELGRHFEFAPPRPTRRSCWWRCRSRC